MAPSKPIQRWCPFCNNMQVPANVLISHDKAIWVCVNCAKRLMSITEVFEVITQWFSNNDPLVN